MSEKIMYDSPEAATYRTDIKGWVSRCGHYCGDGDLAERSARYAGSTHRICDDCGGEYLTMAYCNVCHERKLQEKFDGLEAREWDGIEPLCIYDGDTYFFGVDELVSFVEDEDGRTVESLRLVFCTPEYGPQFDEDYFSDYLPEEGELPDSIYEAMKEFNAVIKAAGPLCWYPGKVKAIVRDLESYYVPARSSVEAE